MGFVDSDSISSLKPLWDVSDVVLVEERCALSYRWSYAAKFKLSQTQNSEL